MSASAKQGGHKNRNTQWKKNEKQNRYSTENTVNSAVMSREMHRLLVLPLK